MDKTHLKFLPLKLSLWLCSELLGAVAGHSELNIYVKRRFYLKMGAYHKSRLFQSLSLEREHFGRFFFLLGKRWIPAPQLSEQCERQRLSAVLLGLSSRLDLWLLSEFWRRPRLPQPCPWPLLIHSGGSRSLVGRKAKLWQTPVSLQCCSVLLTSVIWRPLLI